MLVETYVKVSKVFVASWDYAGEHINMIQGRQNHRQVVERGATRSPAACQGRPYAYQVTRSIQLACACGTCNGSCDIYIRSVRAAIGSWDDEYGALLNGNRSGGLDQACFAYKGSSTLQNEATLCKNYCL